MPKAFRSIVIAIVCSLVFSVPVFAASVWSQASVPGNADSGEGVGVELGMKFRVDTNGYVAGVRFYKSIANTGTHIGNLWSSNGTPLASAVFSNETSSGWQQVTFSTPVAVTAGTTYIVSYYAPNGHYAFDPGFFSATGIDNAPLHALANGIDGGNGVYAYGSASSFPNSSYNSSNYWVDVVFIAGDSTTLPAVVSTVPAGAATGVAIDGAISAVFNQPMDPSTMTSGNFVLVDSSNNPVSGVVSYDSSRSAISIRPNPVLNGQTSYTATVKGAVRDFLGHAMGADYSWTFTTTAAPPTGNCPCSIWSTSTVPPTPDSGDGSGIELGVKIRIDSDGYITGVRFFKSTLNSGTHIGNLWTTGGVRLATATFTNETGSGWQQVNFNSPVFVTAGTTYVVSYYAPNGHYAYTAGFFNSNGVDNAPMHALASGVEGGNGVYRYGGTSAFPNTTFGAANYWIDAVFFQSTSTSLPTVASTLPGNGQGGGNLGGPIKASFTHPMDPATINTSNFVLRDANGNPIAGSVSYDPPSATLSFVPSSNLNALSEYTATVKGTVQNFLGRALGGDYNWSFTTSRGCPCTIWNANVTPSMTDSQDGQSVEVGVKLRSDADGYITGIRFYKSALNTGTHIANLWTAFGGNLASATVSGEPASGWQQIQFAAPVPVVAGTTYIASYYAPNGHYAYDPGFFTSTGVDNSPLHALMNGIDGGNGIYRYASTSGFPDSTYNAGNYWIDVIYVQNTSQVAPLVTATSPSDGETNVGLGGPIRATFSQPMDASSLTASTFVVTDASNNVLQGSVSYDSGSFTASFVPNPGFSALSAYKATIKSSARDSAGNILGKDYSWTFTTSPPPPSSGPGGPILIISTVANPFTQYLGEILLAEGMNEFIIADISGVTSSTLSAYDVVILGDMKLTLPQASMITSWVNGGGNLIAMHPDKQLATLLGLTSTTGTLLNAYLGTITSSSPGQGIVSDTIQFHGSADLYNLAGATMVARLYSNATTSTSFPAVTWKNSGSGRAAAFTYDLARSIVYTRQGNPSWSGQKRIPYGDPTCPNCDQSIIRAEDLFFGNASSDPQPDWINLNKVAIPQADEQQRLLVNLIQFMNLNRKPLPRFWYLPSGFKAAVIMTGDDHHYFGMTGTKDRFDQYIADSPAGCSVADWTCIRATSYIFPADPIPMNYSSYVQQGFEIANHADHIPSCTNYTPQSLDSAITSQLSVFAQNYPGIAAPKTNRTHCVLWSDYDSQPQILENHGIRLDTSYYYWPQEWILDRPGMFTGSGFPMRHADRNGNIIDVYQATTQMPDESLQTFPMTIDTLLDNALGSKGFYGVFTTNMHTDFSQSDGSDAIVTSAKARGVPVISALQMLTWLDGRNTSKFGSFSWANNRLNFSITAGTGSRNLQAVVPARSSTRGITSITRNGSSVSFSRQTIKGISYAVFTATAGSYQVTYTSQ